MELPNLMEPMQGVIVAIMNKLAKDIPFAQALQPQACSMLKDRLPFARQSHDEDCTVFQAVELPNLMEPMRGVIVAIMNKLKKDIPFSQALQP